MPTITAPGNPYIREEAAMRFAIGIPAAIALAILILLVKNHIDLDRNREKLLCVKGALLGEKHPCQKEQWFQDVLNGVDHGS